MSLFRCIQTLLFFSCFLTENLLYLCLSYLFIVYLFSSSSPPGFSPSFILTHFLLYSSDELEKLQAEIEGVRGEADKSEKVSDFLIWGYY